MAWGICARCGWQYNLSELRKEWTSLRVCPSCFDPRPAYLSPPRVKPEGVPLPNASPEPDSPITFIAALNLNTADQSTNASGEATLSLTGLTLLDGDVLVVALLDEEQLNIRIYSASENSDSSVTVTDCAASSIYCARVLQYRGVDSMSSLDAERETATGSDGDDADPPSLTPEVANTRVVAIYAALRTDSSATWTAPANVSNFAQTHTENTTGGVEPAVGTGDYALTSGTFDPDAVSGDAVGSWAAATIALKAKA